MDESIHGRLRGGILMYRPATHRTTMTMNSTKDEIARILEAAEEAAYKRGWDDACDAMKEAADSVKAAYFAPPMAEDMAVPTTVVMMPHHGRTGRPASAAIVVVEDCINSSPGKKGVEVVKAVQLVDPAIPERTVRTALRRLKMHKKIWQRNGLWYPKPVRYRPELLDAENNDEEANNSPPHQ
jgi:hypothetical protein